ncbi:MAG: hypothetical protein IT431_11510 [Phycisphaerales bacterium]|nr:hypothetical protein [Phycisphaerales bacterium]
MTPTAAILLLVVPAILCAGVLLAAGLLAARGRGEGGAPARPPAWARGAAPVAFAAGRWSADFALHQAHPVWDRDGTMRYLAVALAAGLVGLVHAAVGRARVTVVLRAVLGAAVPAAVLAPLAGERYVAWPVFWVLVPATGVWLVVAGGLLDRAERALARLTAPVALACVAGAAAPGVFLSGYAGGANLLGGLGALAGGAAVAKLGARRGGVELSGGWTVWLAAFAAVVLVTFGYADVPAVWVLPVLALAPLGVGAGLLVKGTAARFAAAVGGVLVVAGAGTVAAGLAAGDDGGGSSGEDGSYYGG